MKPSDVCAPYSSTGVCTQCHSVMCIKLIVLFLLQPYILKHLQEVNEQITKVSVCKELYDHAAILIINTGPYIIRVRI